MNHVTFPLLPFYFPCLVSILVQNWCLSVVTQAEVGAPGLVVGVSVDGAQVWCEGWCLKSPLKMSYMQHL